VEFGALFALLNIVGVSDQTLCLPKAIDGLILCKSRTGRSVVS
jgi:hypothetical protein